MFVKVKKTWTRIVSRAKQTNGAGLLEYGMIAGLVSVLSVFAVMSVGKETEEVFCIASEGIQDGMALGGVGEKSEGKCRIKAFDQAQAGENGSQEDDADLTDDLEQGDPEDSDNAYVRPDPEKNPKGFDDERDRFVEAYEFPMYTTERQYVFGPITAFPENTNIVRVGGQGRRDLRVCLERENKAKNCFEKYQNGVKKEGDTQVGWSVVLPKDTRVDWAHTFDFHFLDATTGNVSKTVEVQATRVPEPYIFEPNLVFEDQFYPEKTHGMQRVMVPLSGNFNGDLTWDVNFAPGEKGNTCVQIRSDSEPVCKSYAQRVPMYAHAIGYEVDLVDKYYYFDVTELLVGTLRNESISRTFVDGEEVSLIQEYTWTVGRERSDLIFEPVIDFPDQTYAQGATGWQEPAMSVLTGASNGGMRFSLTWGKTHIDSNDLQLCLQKTSTSATICGADETGVAHGSRSVSLNFRAEDYYALGYRVSLPESDKIEVNESVEVSLKSYNDGISQNEMTWAPNQFREGVPYVFETNMAFPNQTYTKGDTGWQAPVMTRFEGAFNASLRFNVNWGSTKFGDREVELCVREMQSSEIVCDAATYGGYQSNVYGYVDFEAGDYYEIGYRVFLNTDDKVDMNENLALTLSLRDQNKVQERKYWTPNQRREAVGYVFEPNMVFPDQTYTKGETGWQAPVMTKVEGRFNDSLRFIIGWSGTNIGFKEANVCVQKTQSSEIVCDHMIHGGSLSNTSANKIFEPGEYYAVGYRLSLPTNTRALFNEDLSVNLQLMNSNKVQRTQTWTPKQYRPEVPYVLETDMAFTTQTYAPGTSGWQDPVMANFEVTSSDPLNFRLSWSTAGSYPGDNQVQMCLQKTPSSDIVCDAAQYGATISSKSAKLTLEPGEYHAIGYRVLLPTNTSLVINKKIQVFLDLVDQGKTQERKQWEPFVKRASLS